MNYFILHMSWLMLYGHLTDISNSHFLIFLDLEWQALHLQRLTYLFTKELHSLKELVFFGRSQLTGSGWPGNNSIYKHTIIILLYGCIVACCFNNIRLALAVQANVYTMLFRFLFFLVKISIRKQFYFSAE